MSVRFDVDAHVARVTIDRPERMNAVDRETEEALNRIWDRIEQDPDIRAVVLTGTGDRAFSAGADMKAGSTSKTGLEYWAEGRENGFGGIALRNTLDVPVIARVNGVAFGGGFEMVLGCDIVVAAEEAQFGLTEPRVGRLALDGGIALLPRLMPQKIAMGLLLTGGRLSAADAAGYGLVNEVVPRADLDAAVDRWLNGLLACAPLSAKAIKQMVRRSEGLTAREAQALRTPALIAALQSEDQDEGVRAFREKRRPIWKGR
ncbi:enoyl-CoA hydratase-related protein [Nitratireductor sp. ZSWI3]|uniref:enoyl-CoA hydratase-related protein n=1 Tax=Nitratireductor sp. ZSWI3 TaxID=2966359 RepID=UPI00214FA2FD|nr:enoyl-CoA hydratase-related protein [Nitratireductor sp. ZSWI3]MCR4268125.1 enoyl-CoA hydratase-related protein [Nitratireductor sp. ZSWI3]